MFFTLKISPFSFVLFCFVLLLLLLCGILGRSVVEEEDEDVELPCFLALFFSGDDDEMFCVRPNGDGIQGWDMANGKSPVGRGRGETKVRAE